MSKESIKKYRVGGTEKVGVAKKNEGVAVEGYHPHNTPTSLTPKKSPNHYYDWYVAIWYSLLR